ncbi:MAG: N-acetyltransferase [Granulosicoccus sp.]|nr:N-acetyltransferase [Granulosicoccus sp.]
MPIALQATTLDDMNVVTEIYAHHVLHGCGSFEEVPPDQQAMQERWQSREAAGYPSLTARIDGRIAGFAYAGNYKPRSAYRFTVEDSIYVAPDHIGQGVGRALLNALVTRCTMQGYRQMIGVIGDSGNQSSITLHERCGFRLVGIARGLGFKHGRWLDVVYMQRALHSAQQAEIGKPG